MDPRIGQTWRRRPEVGRTVGVTRIKIERLARRSVIGPLTISGIDLTAKGQVRYTQLAAKWERE